MGERGWNTHGTKQKERLFVDQASEGHVEYKTKIMKKMNQKKT